MNTHRGHLKQLLVHVLAATPGRTATELQNAVAAEGNVYSIQGIYKDLRALQTEGVVVKTGKRYNLGLSWVFEYLSLADLLNGTYVERPRVDVLPRHPNTREIWHFTNLLRLNDFWSHVLLLLVQQSANNIVLGWNPHPWFHLVQTKKEDRFIQALRRTHSRLFLIVGGKTFLDRWTERFWDATVVEYSFGQSPFHHERSLYYNVVGEYVLTVRLSIETARAIDALYNQTTDMDDLDPASLVSLCNKKTNASMWLEHNPKKARILTTKFKKYWGVDFERLGSS